MSQHTQVAAAYPVPGHGRMRQACEVRGHILWYLYQGNDLHLAMRCPRCAMQPLLCASDFIRAQASSRWSALNGSICSSYGAHLRRQQAHIIAKARLAAYSVELHLSVQQHHTRAIHTHIPKHMYMYSEAARRCRSPTPLTFNTRPRNPHISRQTYQENRASLISPLVTQASASAMPSSYSSHPTPS
jgi:hypothetical protein